MRFELRRGACVLYAAASHGLLAQPLALAFANRLAVWLNSSFLRHRSVSAATIQHHFRILPPGLGTLSGTKATQHNHYSIPPKYKYIILPLKCAAFNPSNNSGQGKGRLQMISANTHSNFDRALTFSLLAQRPNFSEDFLNSL